MSAMDTYHARQVHALATVSDQPLAGDLIDPTDFPPDLDAHIVQ